jgi:hypothetical protein
MPSNRRSSEYPAHIGSILSGSFSALGLKARLKEYEIRKEWAGIVGKNISKRARPAKLIGKTLHVKVSSSPWMTELQFLKREIISKINKMLGEDTVTDMVFKAGSIKENGPGPGEKKTRPISPEEKLLIDRIVSEIKDKGLRELVKRAMVKGKSIEG